LYRTIVDYREEDVQPFSIAINKIKQRVLRNDASNVFLKWKKDTQLTLQQCLDYDSSNWKLNKIEKKPEKEKNVLRVIKQHYDKLKAVFIKVASDSSYPEVTPNDFVVFCQNCNFIDQRLPFSSMGRYFIAANYSENGKATIGLNRYQFIEALVRIAVEKYKASGRV